jgi:hypothetical protein
MQAYLSDKSDVATLHTPLYHEPSRLYRMVAPCIAALPIFFLKQ